MILPSDKSKTLPFLTIANELVPPTIFFFFCMDNCNSFLLVSLFYSAHSYNFFLTAQPDQSFHSSNFTIVTDFSLQTKPSPWVQHPTNYDLCITSLFFTSFPSLQPHQIPSYSPGIFGIRSLKWLFPLPEELFPSIST